MRAFLLFFVCLFAAPLNSPGQNSYYVCSYANADWGTNILFSKIDVDNKLVVFSKEIPITGAISFAVPPRIEHLGRQYFFLATVYGLWGHNSPAAEQYAHFALVDDGGGIVQIDSLRDSHFLHSIDSLEAGVMFDDRAESMIIASLSMDTDMKIIINKVDDYIYRDKDHPTVGGFRYFKPIDAENERIFTCMDQKGPYLLVIDRSNRILIDSLNISTAMGYSYLFGMSADNSIVYMFNIDCFCRGWRYPCELASIAPSYLKRFSAEDLSLIDSLHIPNPCIDSVCFDYTWATCDRIGHYLVYFFMQTAHIEWYPPALLFIFDTRTNEASWLRVGWR